MRTLDFKVWLLTLFLCTAPPTTAVVINVNHAAGYTAAMNGQKEITYLDGCEWQDGDMVDITESGVECAGHIWRYDNNGHFTSIGYPWWYTGAKPTEVTTKVVW